MLARALVGFAAGLLLSASAVFVASGWQAGVGCLAAAAACAVLGWDIDRVMRESRWVEADRQRAAQALAEARTPYWSEITASNLVEMRSA